MKTLKRPLIWIVAAAMLSTVGFVTAQSAMTAKPTAIAVVDLGVLVDGLDEKAEREADMNRMNEQLQNEVQQRRNRIEAMRNDLEILKVGSDAFKSKQEELQNAAIELNVWLQFQQQKSLRDSGLMMEDLYRKCVDAISRTASEAGYDAVFYKEPSPNFQYENGNQLSAQIQIRKLIWASDSIDITNAVIQRMNNEHANSQ